MHQRKKARHRQNWFDQLEVSVSPPEETDAWTLGSLSWLWVRPILQQQVLISLEDNSPDAGEVGMSFPISESNWLMNLSIRRKFLKKKKRFITEWRRLSLWVFTPRACLSSPESVSESLELFPSCFSSCHIQKHLTAKMHHKHTTLQVLGTYLSCRREKI